jgi:hypothetical protein
MYCIVTISARGIGVVRNLAANEKNLLGIIDSVSEFPGFVFEQSQLRRKHPRGVIAKAEH